MDHFLGPAHSLNLSRRVLIASAKGSGGGAHRDAFLPPTLHRGKNCIAGGQCSLHAEVVNMARPRVETHGRVVVVRDGEHGEVLAQIEIIDGGFVCKVEPRHLGPDAMGATVEVLTTLLLYDLDIEAAAKAT